MKHVAQFVHSLQIGGAEVLAANIASGLTRNGYKCSLWGMAGSGELALRLRDQGIETRSFDCPRSISPVVMGHILRVLLSTRVDCIVTHHFRQLFHAVPAVILTGKRLIHVEHDYHFYEDSPIYFPRLKFLLRYVAKFVAVSQEVASLFDAAFAGGVRCLSIPNGIDTQHFRRMEDVRCRMRHSFGFTEDNLVIGTCARLEPVKQVELLIQGFAEYASQNANARLVVVGDGSERDRLKGIAESLNVAKKVLFAGACSNVVEYLNMFDIFALTSINEGFPLALLEAMAVGLPVVATNVGSIASVVDSETGILLEGNASVEVAEAFKSLEDNSIRRRIGEKARNIVVQKYSQENMIDLYIQAIEGDNQKLSSLSAMSFGKHL